MRLVLALLLFVAPAAMRGQSLLDSASATRLANLFDARKDDQRLRCEVMAVPPQLNFSFRFQTGYVFRVPMNQYFGPNHRWNILTRVSPAAGGQPAYLASQFRLPNVPKTKRVAEWGGFYWVGEGKYSVEWLLYDDSGRVCRKQWNIEAKLSPNERGVTPGMAAGTVDRVSFRRWSPQDDTADVHALQRLTVLLHAAPLFPRAIRFRAQDRLILLGSLASLLESLPARAVRLIIFNVDQQKILFRQDAFTPDSFDQAAQSMENLQLQLVDYSVLKNQGGHISLLADLVNQELSAGNPSDAVIFLGPATRYFDKFPPSSLEDRPSATPRFFYLQYKPYVRPGAEFADSIEFALRRVHGKKLVVHTADEFARAIKQVETQVATEK
jgi:hypothetical protein